jgi:glycosyltransferase involved in cell wall biosynthesis
MSVHNGMPYLPEAVDSVLRQTLTDLEFVIVDDGSTDGSGEYLDGRTDGRVRVLRERHAGLPAALNRGLELCRGQFVARMDADDVCLPERLERQVGFLSQHPDVGVVGSSVVCVGPTGTRGGLVAVPTEHEAVLKRLLARGLALCHPSVCFRASALRSIGGYRDLPAEDMDVFLRLTGSYRLANVEEPLLLWRVHPRSVTAQQMKKHQAGYLYHIECYRRRQRGEAVRSYEQFLAHMRDRPPWARLAWELDNYALGQYKIGLGQMLGGSPVRGRVRLVWAALCSPPRALKRAWRIASEGLGRTGGRARKS